MTPSFWGGKRVLVTGHTGFKGAWLCLVLGSLGASVHGFSLPPQTQPNLFSAARLARRMRSVEGDVRDLASVERALEAARPEVIFHLAAKALVRESYLDPTGTISTNVVGTANVLEAVRRRGDTRAVVVVTSDKCYENREWRWPYREKSALGGRDPYSASKACAELVVRAFRESYFAGVGKEAPALATARAGNVVGGGDWSADRLVPDTVRALEAGRPVELRFPQAIRPWQHVLEPLSGYILLAERLHADGPDCAEAWNFAPPEEDAKPVGWLVAHLQEAWGQRVGWVPQEGPRPHEHIFLKLDSSMARSRLGWSPRLRIDDTVAWVVDWYRRHAEGSDALALCEEQ
ncbi:MAG TPA: CDP-glucose 4,6-dehydratase, partial [Thermoanaerobaculia bacterium]|nr:CDP-glucose 4,6-dehydratase [Thermoanaerobaculia bacterium]